MTFEKALELKRSYGFEYFDSEIEGKISRFRLLVIPDFEIDYIKYRNGYRTDFHNFNDSTAKDYSGNDKYSIIGLSLDNEGTVHTKYPNR